MSKRAPKTRQQPAPARKPTGRACQHSNPCGVLGQFFWCPVCGAILLSPRATTLNPKNPWTLPTHDPAAVPENLRHLVGSPGK